MSEQELRDTDLRDTLPARRRAELVRLVRARGQVTVTELASLFDISVDTVRRDLDHLAERGLLARTHGGAVASGDLVTQDTPFADRLVRQKSAKTRIARAVASLIGDGETLLVNGGSTTRAVAAELAGRRNLTIVTNNLALPQVLPPEACRDVYVMGGQYRHEAQVTVGEVRFAFAAGINVDTALIGVGGISAERGLSTTSIAESVMIREMIKIAKRTIVLVDSSKFGHDSFAEICPLALAHMLVTDEVPPDRFVQALAEAKVDLVVAPA
ncbi:DeoR/GlpR family DNA-binding transcription regulator [Geminicoccus roseus]|uniref:DeoR/GlpR family DNA-binding transcription regulator n=1 Tax=Geminicoccus roseus TaxID=404900 RepID=UPI0004245E42|nr:DeoR/GlpR family DNA-binding transcription regulator [Geminicoccus roseus]